MKVINAHVSLGSHPQYLPQADNAQADPVRMPIPSSNTAGSNTVFNVSASRGACRRFVRPAIDIMNANTNSVYDIMTRLTCMASHGEANATGRCDASGTDCDSEAMRPIIPDAVIPRANVNSSDRRAIIMVSAAVAAESRVIVSLVVANGMWPYIIQRNAYPVN